jgi:uncharacterized protein (TIGR02722 family)
MKKILISVGVSFLLIGCASSHSGKVVRIDSKSIKDTDIDYGVEDLHLYVDQMVSSMLQSPIFQNSKPMLTLGGIRIDNSVTEHVDTKQIKHSIRTNLIKSNKVGFIDNENTSALEGEIDYQNSSEYIDKSTAKAKGNFIAPDYILSGDISAIKKDNGLIMDNFYVLTLKLTDIKTRMIAWTEEKEIRKTMEK